MTFEILITDPKGQSATVIVLFQNRMKEASTWSAFEPQSIGRSNSGTWEFDPYTRVKRSLWLLDKEPEGPLLTMIHPLDLTLFDVERFPFQAGDSGTGHHEVWDKRIEHGFIDWKCQRVR